MPKPYLYRELSMSLKHGVDDDYMNQSEFQVPSTTSDGILVRKEHSYLMQIYLLI